MVEEDVAVEMVPETMPPAEAETPRPSPALLHNHSHQINQMNHLTLETQAPQEAGGTEEAVGAVGAAVGVVALNLKPEARSAWDLKDSSVDV